MESHRQSARYLERLSSKGSGSSAILVAFFGFLIAARNGRSPPVAPTISFGGPEGRSAEPSAIALQTVAIHLCRIAAILEIEADER